jgi:hypothetical protein
MTSTVHVIFMYRLLILYFDMIVFLLNVSLIYHQLLHFLKIYYILGFNIDKIKNIVIAKHHAPTKV